MISPSDADYQETKRILLGYERMLASREELAKWIEKTYATRVLNVRYRAKNSMGQNLPGCNLLHVVVLRRRDRDTIAQGASSEITRKLREIVKRNDVQGYDLEDLRVVSVAFLPVAFWDAVRKVSDTELQEIKHLVDSPSIWTVVGGAGYGFEFLLFSDEQARQYDTPESRQRCAAACFEIVRRHDETGLLTPHDLSIGFNSKQTVDREYRGDLQSFTRRR